VLVCTALVCTNILKTVILAQARIHGMQPCAIEVNEFGQVLQVVACAKMTVCSVMKIADSPKRPH
jgi:hypothetical protein